MHVNTRNVNTAFCSLVEGVHTGSIDTIRTTSRNGDVLQIPEPMIITYQQPRERVLFNKARDANPFFHLFETVWMLSGSNDVNSVAFFAPNMFNYSDDGETLNGAYGYRWRGGMFDQLSLLIEHLQNKPDSRRAVLQMWNVSDDLLALEASKDVCCNLSVCFSISDASTGLVWGPNAPADKVPGTPIAEKYLDMTVFNRSNDLVWGCLGANVVHFSMLQEYMACALGMRVGVYNQISNNLHVYVNNWQPEKWLEEEQHSGCYPVLPNTPLFSDRGVFDTECVDLVTVFSPNTNGFPNLKQVHIALEKLPIYEPFLAGVVRPMCLAFISHKERRYDQANYYLAQVTAPDWKKAGTEWVERRSSNWQAKQALV